MRTQTNRLLLFVCAGMEFSWMYAWAFLAAQLFVRRPFPLFEAIGTFGLAIALTVWSQGKGLRVIQIAALHLCGLLLTGLTTLHKLYYPTTAFFARRWLSEMFHTPKAPQEEFILLIMLSGIVAFWGAGVLLVRRSPTHLSIGSRFDLGILALLGVLLLKIPLQQELHFDASLLETLLFPFFLFSVLALGVARSLNDVQKQFLAGYQSLGAILSFAALVLLLGAGIVSLCLPYLNRMAETGYRVLKAGAEPFVPLLERLLRFLFGSARFRVEPPPSTGGNPVESVPSGFHGGFQGHGIFLDIMFWGLAGLTILLLLGVAIRHLWPWLMSRTSLDRPEHEHGHWIWAWIRAVLSFLMLCREILGRQFRVYRRAAQLYTALLRWGRYSGVPDRADETPLEFGSRLKHNFPKLSREIDVIIDAFHQEIYAERTLDPQQLAAAQQALSSLRSPALWASRLKSSFL